MHNLQNDESRLQNALDEKRLRLRFNQKIGCCQVWYEAPDGELQLVTNAEGHYSIGQIIHELKERQRDRRQLLEMFEKQMEANQKSFDQKNKDLAEETASMAGDWRFGKVVTSACTKDKNGRILIN